MFFLLIWLAHDKRIWSVWERGKEKFVDVKMEEMNGEQTALIHFFFCEICYVFPLCLLLPLASYTLNAEKFIADMCDMCFFFWFWTISAISKCQKQLWKSAISSRTAGWQSRIAKHITSNTLYELLWVYIWHLDSYWPLYMSFSGKL